MFSIYLYEETYTVLNNFVDKNTLKTPCESRLLGDGLTNLFVMNVTKYDTKANKNKKWTVTVIDEVKKLLALIIVTGIIIKKKQNKS